MTNRDNKDIHTARGDGCDDTGWCADGELVVCGDGHTAGWRGGLTILHERVLDQKQRVERGVRSIFDHYRHHIYTADGYRA